MTALIWYCRNRKCRRIIRYKGDRPYMPVRCECSVPSIGQATRVTW